jgi:multimeric flavodoxin WrbA
MGKKVLIITGSPRLKGNTNALVTAFASGAVAAGNEVEVFDAATANLNGCHADKSCEQRGCCGQKDDGVRMNELMREADVLVLASPVYWSGFTSQIYISLQHLLIQIRQCLMTLFMPMNSFVSYCILIREEHSFVRDLQEQMTSKIIRNF